MINEKLFRAPDGGVAFHPILMQLAARLYGKTYAEFMTDYHVLVDSNMKCLGLIRDYANRYTWNIHAVDRQISACRVGARRRQEEWMVCNY